MRKRLLVLGMVLSFGVMGAAGCSGSSVDTFLDSGEDSSNEKTEQESSGIGSSTLELYEFLEENSGYDYSMSTTAADFIEAHEDLFPAEDTSVLEQYTDRSVEYKHLNKNVEKYGDKLFADDEMYVLDIHEKDIGENQCLTKVHVLDDSGNSFIVLYADELPDVFKEDTVSVCGLPLGVTSFDNVGGGSTIAVVLAGCKVEGSVDYSVYENVVSMYTNIDDFALYDLDEDGIEEMIVSYGTCTADWSNDIWTIKDGIPQKLGEIGGTRSCYESEDGGIYAVNGHMDHEILDHVYKSGNELVVDNVYDGMIDSMAGEEYYSNDKPLLWYEPTDLGVFY